MASPSRTEDVEASSAPLDLLGEGCRRYDTIIESADRVDKSEGGASKRFVYGEDPTFLLVK